MMRRVAALAVFASLLVPAVANTPAHAVGNPYAHPDFNNDGFADLLIAQYGLAVSGQTNAGGFFTVLGSASGPNVATGKLFTQATAGVPGSPQANGEFGFEWAAGDFNGDGYDDAAVCSAFANVGAAVDAGQVWVFYGGPSGLKTSGVGTINRNTPGVPGVATANEEICRWSLVAGDFNRDGRSDLVINSDAVTVGGHSNAGALFVVPGTPAGLTGAGTLYVDKNSPGIAGGPIDNGFFSYTGSGVADFNGDGYQDLTVSAEYDTVGGHTNAGGFHVLFGSPAGLKTTGSQYITKDTTGVPGASGDSEYFSEGNVAVGDFDRDGYADAAIPAPYQTVSGLGRAGAFYIFRGSSHGLTTTGITVFDKNSSGIAGAPQANGYLGDRGNAAGDFNRDGNRDLLIADYHATVSGLGNAGGFYELFTHGAGVSGAGSKYFTQDTPGVTGAAEASDYFSYAPIFVGDYNGDGYDDAEVPAGYEDLGATTNAGIVYVFYGGSAGLKTNAKVISAAMLPGGTDVTNGYFGDCCS